MESPKIFSRPTGPGYYSVEGDLYRIEIPLDRTQIWSQKQQKWVFDTYDVDVAHKARPLSEEEGRERAAYIGALYETFDKQ